MQAFIFDYHFDGNIIIISIHTSVSIHLILQYGFIISLIKVYMQPILYFALSHFLAISPLLSGLFQTVFNKGEGVKPLSLELSIQNRKSRKVYWLQNL